MRTERGRLIIYTHVYIHVYIYTYIYLIIVSQLYRSVTHFTQRIADQACGDKTEANSGVSKSAAVQRTFDLNSISPNKSS